ncbi:MAG: hypothetical protein ABEH58_03215 [Haloplanus sp.]
MSRTAGAVVVAVLLGSVTPAAGAAVGLGDATVSPTAGTTTLDLSVNVTGVSTSDRTTDANVTVTAPEALDFAGTTAATPAATPNATGVTARIDEAANAVVVSWDDDTGVNAETVTVTVGVSGVAVGRGTHDLTAAVDADGDGTTDATGSVGTVTASATGSDRTITAGDVVYLGEEDVDLTRLDGVAPAGSSQRFYGASGDIEGNPAAVDDTLAADVTTDDGFGVGTYGPAGAVDASAISVGRPNVTDVKLSPADTPGDTDVSGSSIPGSVETLIVDPQFDFAAADNATVVVENADGLELTGELAAGRCR